MITYKKIRPTHKALNDYFIIQINRITMRLAKRNARELAKLEGRPQYVLDFNDLFILLNSAEKDDINRKMPKGSEMNIREFHKYKIFETNAKGEDITVHT